MLSYDQVSQVVLVLENLPASVQDARDIGSISDSGRFPWRRVRKTTLVSLPGESP